ncbi:MAG: hypothetical protein ABGX16_01010 [Pirellulales bacterium]
MRYQLISTLALVLLSTDANTVAQRRSAGRSGSFQSGPAIGTELPDVTAVDENGREISLRSML